MLGYMNIASCLPQNDHFSNVSFLSISGKESIYLTLLFQKIKPFYSFAFQSF